jgi:transcriptional regulator of heat shock response
MTLASGHVEALLTEAGEVLSGLSRGAGVVMAGKQDVRIRHLEFVPLDPGKACWFWWVTMVRLRIG